MTTQTLRDERRAMPSDVTPARAGFVLALIVTCQLMIVLDATVVNVALPPIQEDLGFSATGLSWVVNAYTLAFGGLLLLGGRLGDAFGRRRVFGAGVALFTISSLVGGAAPSESVLVAARAVQGVGAAVAAPSALAILISGCAKLDDEVVELMARDVLRVAPAVVRSFEAGPEGLDLICIGGRKLKGGDTERFPDFWD